ncbi:MAG: TolC family protein [Sandaracinaceae bacterium]|nr:TolC family protein [Sandaracinaceae bacterium]
MSRHAPSLCFWNAILSLSRPAILWICVGPLSLHSQASERLRFDGRRAIEEALLAHPGYRAALLEFQRAKERVRAEAARYVPSLRAESAFQLGNTPSLQFDRSVAFPYSESLFLSGELLIPFDTGTALSLRLRSGRFFRRQAFSFQMGMPPIVAELGPGYTLELGLALSQSLLRGFGSEAGRAELRQAEAALSATHAARLRRANELIRDTLIAYAELWFAQARLESEKKSLEAMRERLSQSEEQVALGRIAPADTLILETQCAAAEERVVMAESERRIRAMALSALVGLPPGAELWAEDPPPRWLEPLEEKEAIERIANSPLLLELHAQSIQAQRLAETTKEALRPRLDARAEVGLAGAGYDDFGQAFEQLAKAQAFSATLGLVYEGPLDDTRLEAERHRAELAWEAAESRLAEARVTLEQETLAWLERRKNAKKRLELAHKTRLLAEQALDHERDRMELGVRTPIALLMAEEELRGALLRENRAETDLYIAEVMLWALSGCLLDGLSFSE